MRIDNGRLKLDDDDKDYNKGYSLHGRMFAPDLIDGVIATVNRYLSQNKN